jgi:chromosome segregation ATPase
VTGMSLTVSDPISLDLLAKHLQAIRNELREIKYNADNDRRNVRSQFENLVATNASQLGDIEARLAARLDLVETLLGDRFGYLDERVDAVEARLAALEERVSRLETHAVNNAQRMDQLIALVQQLVQHG